VAQVSLDEVSHIWRVLEATPTRRARLLPELDSLEAELLAARWVNPVQSEMENIIRGPTFGDFVTILTEGSMQDSIRLQDYRVQEYRLPSPPLLNVVYCVRVSLRTVKYSLRKGKGSGVIPVYLWVQWSRKGKMSQGNENMKKPHASKNCMFSLEGLEGSPGAWRPSSRW
jgi:hypothetical protein